MWSGFGTSEDRETSAVTACVMHDLAWLRSFMTRKRVAAIRQLTTAGADISRGAVRYTRQGVENNSERLVSTAVDLVTGARALH